MAAQTETIVERNEAATVEAWRSDQAEALGLDALKAVTFAAGRGDLGALRSLIARGCSPDIAFRIVHED